MKRIIFISVILFPVLILFSGCATPTIKGSVKITPIVIATPSIHGAHLLGGDGLDRATAIASRADGSYILLGYTLKSFGESTDLFVASYSAKDEFLWAHTYGGTHREYAAHGILTSDGGFLMIGSSQSLFYTLLKVLSPSIPARPIAIKIGSLGEVEWAISIDDHRLDFRDVIQMKDGAYLIVGDLWETEESDEENMYAIKITQRGTILWAYRYDGNLVDEALGVSEGADSSAVVAGVTIEDKGWANLLVMKIDRHGLPLWAKAYEVEKNQHPHAMASLPDRSYAVTGWLGEEDAEKDIFVARLSSVGDLIWYQVYGSLEKDEPWSILRGHGQDLLVVGQTGVPENRQATDGIGLLIGSDGLLKASTVIQGNLNEEVMAAALDANDGYFLFGDTESFSASYADQILLRWSPGASQTRGPFSQKTLTARPVNIHVEHTPLDVFPTDLTEFIETKRLTLRDDST